MVCVNRAILKWLKKIVVDHFMVVSCLEFVVGGSDKTTRWKSSGRDLKRELLKYGPREANSYAATSTKYFSTSVVVC
jgi:hypothetical protein